MEECLLGDPRRMRRSSWTAAPFLTLQPDPPQGAAEHGRGTTRPFPVFCQVGVVEFLAGGPREPMAKGGGKRAWGKEIKRGMEWEVGEEMGLGGGRGLLPRATCAPQRPFCPSVWDTHALDFDV